MHQHESLRSVRVFILKIRIAKRIWFLLSLEVGNCLLTSYLTIAIHPAQLGI
jgi:hypothetical protein